MVLTVQMQRSLNNVIFSHTPWGAIYHMLSSILVEVKMINFYCVLYNLLINVPCGTIWA